MIIDSHSHIYDEAFDEDLDEMIIRAKKVGVGKILLPNIDIESINKVNNLVAQYPEICIPMMGLHPTCVSATWEDDLEVIKTQFQNNVYCAVGEIGIDLYWDRSLQQQQTLAFEKQLRWSIEFDLPVSIHCREAIVESVECIHRVGADKLRGVFHSFGGNAEELKSILELNNFLIGVNGTVTYKNSKLPEVLIGTGLSNVIIETDAPYLPPVPFRGKRNEPSYTHYIVEKLSDIYKISTKKVESITTENAIRLFNLNVKS